MKKLLSACFIIAVIFLGGCDMLGDDTTTSDTPSRGTPQEQEQDQPKVIDERLIGDWDLNPVRWTFTEDTIYANHGYYAAHTAKAYTKDGDILSYETDEVLYRYEFLTPSSFDEELKAAQGNVTATNLINGKIALATLYAGHYVRFVISTIHGDMNMESLRASEFIDQ